jgi:hypothetical protein
VVGTGRPSGTVARTYDNNFWVDSLKVNGATVADYSYDNDGLINGTGTGALSIARNAQTGDIASTTLVFLRQVDAGLPPDLVPRARWERAQTRIDRPHQTSYAIAGS